MTIRSEQFVLATPAAPLESAASAISAATTAIFGTPATAAKAVASVAPAAAGLSSGTQSDRAASESRGAVVGMAAVSGRQHESVDEVTVATATTVAVEAAESVLALQRKQALLMAAASADNTRKTYQAAVRHYLKSGGSLPASQADLTAYLLNCADHLSPRTISLRLTAISQWHRYQGFPDPCHSPDIRKLLAGIMRMHARPAEKAHALSPEQLGQMHAWLAQQTDLKSVRDAALIMLGFYGGLRRSELAGAQCSWLHWSEQGLIIELPRSKTDQSGQGIRKAIPYAGHEACPLRCLQRWLSRSGIVDGALFRSINQWGQVADKPLNPASINLIINQLAQSAGLQIMGKLSSHSLRRGMATSAYRAGAAFRDIKKQGGWRHDGTVHGYIEEAGLFEENALHALYRINLAST